MITQKIALAFILALLISSCNLNNGKKVNIYDLNFRQNLPKILVADKGFKNQVIATETFKLYTESKIINRAKPVNIYLEGDGFAWENINKLSTNPTPTDPVALKLAISDNSSNNILYLARPCQYTKDSLCDSKYWSGARFSKEVILSINSAIDSFLLQNGLVKNSVNLIGYSGGGAVATLLGALRIDIASIRTVAGNLDHSLVNNIHKVTQLDDSLNPAVIAEKISTIPQIHFTSKKDAIVPPFVAGEFARDSGNTACVRIYELDKPTHSDGWNELWQQLVKLEPSCNYGVSYLQPVKNVGY
ncbi:MAG: alpha/beta hydrolase [Alphaproteobacteria bacterium]|jgi:hypothetical protein